MIEHTSLRLINARHIREDMASLSQTIGHKHLACHSYILWIYLNE
jgi:hypothetical protein